MNNKQVQFALQQAMMPRGRPLHLTLTLHEGGWAPQSVWTSKENLAPKRVQTPDQ